MVHSVYMDNTEGALYSKRLIREEESKLLRFRWYGDDTPSDSVYIELKTHRNNKPSTKERCRLSPDDAREFSEGGEVAADVEDFAMRTSRMISDFNLKRSLRTEYYRTAFEDKSNRDYRASLDNVDMNVTLMPEWERNGPWVRQVEAANSTFVFPFAVLELKVSTHALESSAAVIQTWVKELTDVGNAIEVNKFSEYLTGYSAHFPGRVQLVPSWMSDVHVSEALRSGRPAPTTPEPTTVIHARTKLFDRVEKKKVPDQKSILDNERTMLALVRTTVLVLYGGSFFLEHELAGPIDSVIGWIGLLVGLGLITHAYLQYRRRNELLCAPEVDLRKYVDIPGTTVLFVSVAVVCISGAIAYQQSILHR